MVACLTQPVEETKVAANYHLANDENACQHPHPLSTGQPADPGADLGEGALTGRPCHLARRQEDSAASRGDAHTRTLKDTSNAVRKRLQRMNQRVAD